jgi:hypothetical protein
MHHDRKLLLRRRHPFQMGKLVTGSSSSIIRDWSASGKGRQNSIDIGLGQGFIKGSNTHPRNKLGSEDAIRFTYG